MIRDNQIKEL